MVLPARLGRGPLPRHSMPTERPKSIFLWAPRRSKSFIVMLTVIALTIPNVINEPIDNHYKDACAATTTVLWRSSRPQPYCCR